MSCSFCDGRQVAWAAVALEAAFEFGATFFGHSWNEGMIPGPARSERMIPLRGMRAPIWVRVGPGPAFPFSPSLWQARQPDWATTSCPPFNVLNWEAVMPAAAAFAAV